MGRLYGCRTVLRTGHQLARQLNGRKKAVEGILRAQNLEESEWRARTMLQGLSSSSGSRQLMDHDGRRCGWPPTLQDCRRTARGQSGRPVQSQYAKDRADELSADTLLRLHRADVARRSRTRFCRPVWRRRCPGVHNVAERATFMVHSHPGPSGLPKAHAAAPRGIWTVRSVTGLLASSFQLPGTTIEWRHGDVTSVALSLAQNDQSAKRTREGGGNAPEESETEAQELQL
ncbi:MAG: hypothetical protein M1826_003178 [Phylliscum demangeonii]|nr:MAG: hypothetical protein M1826_003178 [Phylliscum demangeonii]